LLLLPDELRSAMLDYISRTLDIRVVASLQAKMSEEQREEFRRFSVLGDTPARLWLERNFPNYINVMQVEFDNLCADIRGVAADILSDEGIEEP
jgi:Protein of unknown function (DUF5663)